MTKYQILLPFSMPKIVKNHFLVHGNSTRRVKTIYVQWKTNVKNIGKPKPLKIV